MIMSSDINKVNCVAKLISSLSQGILTRPTVVGVAVRAIGVPVLSPSRLLWTPVKQQGLD